MKAVILLLLALVASLFSLTSASDKESFIKNRISGHREFKVHVHSNVHTGTYHPWKARRRHY